LGQRFPPDTLPSKMATWSEASGDGQINPVVAVEVARDNCFRTISDGISHCDPFELNTAQESLARNGTRVKVQDLPHRLLIMLAERQENTPRFDQEVGWRSVERFVEAEDSHRE
jgi:hypothetical protein